VCSNCGDLQYTKNEQCRVCGTPKQEAIAKPGDWYCPGCGDLQYAKNATCRICTTPRPLEGDVRLVTTQGRGGVANSCGNTGVDRPTNVAGGVLDGARPGDWMCPSCNDLNFARNVACRKCNTTKPESGMTGHIVAKPGDWTCPSCKDLQYAKNAVCRLCLTPRPNSLDASSGKGAGRFPSVPGDWTCPICGDLQFARNSACRKCSTPKPHEGSLREPMHKMMRYA